MAHTSLSSSWSRLAAELGERVVVRREGPLVENKLGVENNPTIPGLTQLSNPASDVGSGG